MKILLMEQEDLVFESPPPGHPSRDLVPIKVTILLFLIASILLQSFMLVAGTHQLSAPLKQLLEKIQQVEQSQKETQQKLYKTSLLKNQAQLHYYRSQINPYFLYNTLECISSMARVYRVPYIESICSSMADLFRYSISDVTTVTLRQEMPMQKMILQPLMENAIKHGFESRDGQCTLLILAQSGKSYQLILAGDNHLAQSHAFNCALCCARLQNHSDCYLYTPPNLTEVERWLSTLEKLYEEKDSEKIHWEISRLADQWKNQGNPASVLMLLSQLTYSIIPNKSMEKTGRVLNLEKFLYDDISSKFSNITEIFDYLTQLLNTDQSEAQEFGQIPKTVSSIKEYLYEHYTEEISLNQIVREFYLTPSYLCEIFKKFTGCTITGYLLKIRMEKASELLLETDLPLADIAAQVSYSDYNYFCRLFKRYYNLPPRGVPQGKEKAEISGLTCERRAGLKKLCPAAGSYTVFRRWHIYEKLRAMGRYLYRGPAAGRRIRHGF